MELLKQIMNREQIILDAARSCYLRLGVEKTAMTDIAVESGVSRATIYRCFSSVDDIFMAVFARESMLMMADANKHLEKFTDPRDHIVEGMLFCLDEVPRRQLHRHFFQSEAKTWAALRVMDADSLHQMCVEVLAQSLGLHSVPAGTDSNPLDHLAELILRLLMSYAMIPSHRARSSKDMGDMLHLILDPIVSSLVGLPNRSGKAKRI
jgi:AcrR family transcriptional regulator